VDVIEVARKLGKVIANKDMVLLTGGTKPKSKEAKKNAPKNSALDGAGAKPWVAVAQGEAVRGHKYRDKTKLGFTITSDLGDKRNYLEALMCDAAIVLYGGEGTRSELTSTLSLQRPVVLLDSRWQGKHDLDKPARDGTLDELVCRARKLFFNEDNAKCNHALDDQLRIAALRAALDRLPPYRYVESTTDEALIDAVQWLARKIKHLPGHFPKIAGHVDAAEAYAVWLGDVAG
jgi:predicted Rossmann-fold nucleotide-binding protein